MENQTKKYVEPVTLVRSRLTETTGRGFSETYIFINGVLSGVYPWYTNQPRSNNTTININYVSRKVERFINLDQDF